MLIFLLAIMKPDIPPKAALAKLPVDEVMVGRTMPEDKPKMGPNIVLVAPTMLL